MASGDGVSSVRAFDYQWYIWRVYGLHRPRGNTFWARHYRAYSILYNLLFNGWVPLSIYLECLMSHDMGEFCETFYLSALVAVEQLKFANVWRVRDQLKRLHVILDHLDGRIKREAERQIIQEHVERTKQIFLWLIRLFCLILGSAAMYVLCSGEELPFPAWYPWDYNASRVTLMLTSTLQMLGMCSLAMMTLNNDTYPVSYLTMVASQYRALALRISLLGHGEGRTRQQVTDELVECIKDHKSILLYVKQKRDAIKYFLLTLFSCLSRLLHTMAEALSVACFYQLMCTATALCTLSFYIIYVQPSASKLLHLFFMLVGIFSETWLICYAAEEVGSSAEEMSQAIYACNWIDQTVRFKRILCFMLKRSQRPVGIWATRLLPVRMTTFLAVRYI